MGVGVTTLALPEVSSEQAYVSAVHCPACEMTMAHVRGEDGEPYIECGKPSCRLFGIIYKAPAVKLQPQ